MDSGKLQCSLIKQKLVLVLKLQHCAITNAFMGTGDACCSLPVSTGVKDSFSWLIY